MDGLDKDFDFDDGDVALGIKPRETERSELGIFDDKETSALQSLVKSGAPTGVDTSKQNVPANEVPEYLNEFKEVLAKPFEVAQEDTTDYSSKALLEFGSEFAHITSKDLYEEELFVRKEEREFLEEYGQDYKILKDIVEGHIEKEKLVRHKVKSHLEAVARQNFEDFNEEVYDEKVSKFFNEDGTLNDSGKRLADNEVANYSQQLKGIQEQAKESAKKELQTLRANKSALESQIKTGRIAGIEISPELGEQIKMQVNSGKTREWLEKNDLTPEQNANREARIALISDDRIWAEIVKILDERGQKHGINVVAKRKFNS